MKYDDINKYYYMGEAEFLSNHKYRAIYILKLYDDVLPYNYVTHQKYKQTTNTSYIDFSKIKNGGKIDDVAPSGTLNIEYSENKATATINTTEDIKQIDNWVLSQDKKTLTKDYEKNCNETITLEDFAGNTTDIVINININPIDNLKVEINDYTQQTENKQNFIGRIQPQVSIGELEDKIKTNGTIKVYKNETEIVDKNIKVATGMKISISLEKEKIEYIAMIIGDINGDAQSNVIDIFNINKYRLKKEEFTIYELKAADVNNDGKVDILDIIKLNKYRLGKLNKL